MLTAGVAMPIMNESPELVHNWWVMQVVREGCKLLKKAEQSGEVLSQVEGNANTRNP